MAEFQEIQNWPNLAWVVKVYKQSNNAEVFYGKHVEVYEDWICEAIWDGDFSEGNFDYTDIIFGSGVRFRGEEIHFVSSCAPVDRLQYYETDTCLFVSNSLPGLFSVCDLQPVFGYSSYFEDFETIKKGLDDYNPCVKTNKGCINLIYGDNLVWKNGKHQLFRKLKSNRDFSNFNKYHSFLLSSVERLTQNLTSPLRRFPLGMMGSLSSGYDTTAVSSLLSEFGLKDAVAISEAREGEQDIGYKAANVLGINLHILNRDGWRNSELSEIPFLAANGKGEDIFFKDGEKLLKGRVLFTGHPGTTVWGKENPDKKKGKLMPRGDQSGISLTEYRLWAGFIHAPIPFLGCAQREDIISISNSEEMKRWDIEGSYSRPIPRRIAEEKGIPREAFGQRKKAASVLFMEPNLDPIISLNWQSYKSFKGSLRKKNLESRGSRFKFWVALFLDELGNGIQTLVAKSSLRNRKIRQLVSKIIRHLKRGRMYQYMFPWAIQEAMKRYSGYKFSRKEEIEIEL